MSGAARVSRGRPGRPGSSGTHGGRARALGLCVSCVFSSEHVPARSSARAGVCAGAERQLTHAGLLPRDLGHAARWFMRRAAWRSAPVLVARLLDADVQRARVLAHTCAQRSRSARGVPRRVRDLARGRLRQPRAWVLRKPSEWCHQQRPSRGPARRPERSRDHGASRGRLGGGWQRSERSRAHRRLARQRDGRDLRRRHAAQRRPRALRRLRTGLRHQPDRSAQYTDSRGRPLARPGPQPGRR